MASAASRIFARGLLLLLAVSTCATAFIYARIYGFDKLFGDFYTFRSAALHAAAHELGLVYDLERLRAMLSHGMIEDFSFFLNPPTGLFLVFPLAFAGPVTALIAWNAVQFALLLLVLRTGYMRRLFAPRPGGMNSQALLTLTFLAFSLQNVLFGQVAVFCCVLFLLVLAWRGPHPAAAGILLGLFSFKPQLGLLLPLLLLMEKNWKTLGWAALTACLMALLSLGLWGTGLWRDYAAIMAARSQFLGLNPSLLFTISTSPYAALRNLGFSAGFAAYCQTAIAGAAILWILPALKRADETSKLLMLILATYLVTPYSLIYDMVLLAVPCALLLRRAEEERAAGAGLMALLLLIFMPLAALLLQIHHIPYCVIAIGFTLIVAKRLENPERTE